MKNQRWTNGEHSWRPAGELIKTSEYDVTRIPRATAKAFVIQHHYSGTFVAERFSYGLFRGAELAGVAVFSHPVQDRVITKVFPFKEAADGAELGRFVLVDEVPGNGETWFLARAFELLRREGIAGVVSFSDPMPRSTAEGRIILPGHVGTIYQAHNAVYLGRGDARTVRILPNGRSYNHRAESKVSTGDRGWERAMAPLLAAGAPELAPGEDPAAWVKTWVFRLTRPLQHRGNHKYAWALDRAARRCLPGSLPYPKIVDQVA